MSRLAPACPCATIAAWIAIGRCGLVAARRLPITMCPDIAFPVVVADDAQGKIGNAAMHRSPGRKAAGRAPNAR